MKDNELTESIYIKPVIEKLDLAKELVENFLIYEEENNELSVRLLGEKIGSINKDRMLERANELPQIEDVEDYNDWVSDVYKEIFSDIDKNEKIIIYDYKKLPNNRIILGVAGEMGGGFQWVTKASFREGIKRFGLFKVDDLIQHIGLLLDTSGISGPNKEKGYEIFIALHEFLRRNELFIDYEWQEKEVYLIGFSSFLGKDEKYIGRVVGVRECSSCFENMVISGSDLMDRKVIRFIHNIKQEMMNADPHYKSGFYHKNSNVLERLGMSYGDYI